MTLPYGESPVVLEIGSPRAVVVDLIPPPPPAPLSQQIARALDAPIGRAPIEQLVGPRARVTVVISDPSRDEPRRAFLDAVRARLPADVRWTIAIATGTHGPCDTSRLDLPSWVASCAVVNHDGHGPGPWRELGRTSFGTVMKVHPCLVDADLVIATGCIRPHYFAGYGGGVKAVFPGLGEATAIRWNHRLKDHPAARAGSVIDNPCRVDLEAAAQLLTTPLFLLNGVVHRDGMVHAVVAGDPIHAFRVGAALCEPWFSVSVPRAALVIASDAGPVTRSLYQAAKIAAAVAAVPVTQLIIVAQCGEGIGPLEVVNEAIFRCGVFPRLSPGVSLSLVSDLPTDQVRRTVINPCSLSDLVRAAAHEDVVVFPQASHLIVRPL